jgi:hypothetical protein
VSGRQSCSDSPRSRSRAQLADPLARPCVASSAATRVSSTQAGAGQLALRSKAVPEACSGPARMGNRASRPECCALVVGLDNAGATAGRGSFQSHLCSNASELAQLPGCMFVVVIWRITTEI